MCKLTMGAFLSRNCVALVQHRHIDANVSAATAARTHVPELSHSTGQLHALSLDSIATFPLVSTLLPIPVAAMNNVSQMTSYTYFV